MSATLQSLGWTDDWAAAFAALNEPRAFPAA